MGPRHPGPVINRSCRPQSSRPPDKVFISGLAPLDKFGHRFVIVLEGENDGPDLSQKILSSGEVDGKPCWGEFDAGRQLAEVGADELERVGVS